MFILHINTIILALLYLGQCTNMLVITALVCRSAVTGYLSFSRSTPFLDGLSPIIMSCSARKMLILCIRWMRFVYIGFTFTANILAMAIITTLKHLLQQIKKLYWHWKNQQIHWLRDFAYGCNSFKVPLDVALKYYAFELKHLSIIYFAQKFRSYHAQKTLVNITFMSRFAHLKRSCKSKVILHQKSKHALNIQNPLFFIFTTNVWYILVRSGFKSFKYFFGQT